MVDKVIAIGLVVLLFVGLLSLFSYLITSICCSSCCWSDPKEESEEKKNKMNFTPVTIVDINKLAIEDLKSHLDEDSKSKSNSDLTLDLSWTTHLL